MAPPFMVRQAHHERILKRSENGFAKVNAAGIT
jgi:hypothetical protein